MRREKKAQTIDQLQKAFNKSTIAILTDFRGLPSSEVLGLRRKLRESGIEYRVVKNTLARIAAEKLGRNDLPALFEGQVAIALGHGDIAQVPKALDDYIRTSRSNLRVKSGFIGDRALTAEAVMALSKLPPKDVLIARVLAQLQSPIVALIYVLSSPIRGVTGVLQARIKQLEGT